MENIISWTVLSVFFSAVAITISLIVFYYTTLRKGDIELLDPGTYGISIYRNRMFLAFPLIFINTGAKMKIITHIELNISSLDSEEDSVKLYPFRELEALTEAQLSETGEQIIALSHAFAPFVVKGEDTTMKIIAFYPFWTENFKLSAHSYLLEVCYKIYIGLGLDKIKIKTFRMPLTESVIKQVFEDNVPALINIFERSDAL